MSTSTPKLRLSKNTQAKHQRSFVPTTALAKGVAFDDAMMHVTFIDGRVLAVPLAWCPALRKATIEQRAHYEIGGGGVSLHSPELDEDLSIAGLMAGVDRSSS